MNWRHWVRKEVAPILLLLVLMTAARSSLADHYYVPSGSMEFSLLPGDRVLVDKTAYGWRIPYTKIDLVGTKSPVRGEIAVFDSPKDGILLIKRVVAIGGDLVEIRDGHLYVNGIAMSTSSDTSLEVFGDRVANLNLQDGGGPSVNNLLVPEDTVLVIGDHRGNSFDSRYFGFIASREFYGRAIAIYYRKEAGFGWWWL